MNVKQWLRWISHRPTALLNFIGLLIIFGIFIFLAFKPIAVLTDWHVSLSTVREYKEVNGERLAVYHPGDSLVFTSKATKNMHASGVTTRSIICYATDRLQLKEIQLDTLPANKPTGVKRTSENGVVVPEVSQFENLPRVCYLNIDIGYDNVIMWRDWSENARSEDFIVEEISLDSASIKLKIADLSQRIKDLEGQLGVEPSDPVPVVVQSTPAPTAPAPTVATTQPADTSSDPTVNQPAQKKSLLQNILEPVLNLLGGK